MNASLAISMPELNMAERTRAFAWDRTPLGPRSTWPAALRISVDAMLASLHPMCLIWGSERILLYNDGYAPILGSRHPDALGYPTAEVWPELWPDLEPLIEGVFRGESVAFRDQPLTMTRNGFTEETWYDFAYSPVWDDEGEVAGLMNITSDSTARVKAKRERDAATAEAQEAAVFMRSVLAASTDCIKVVELDGTLSFMSEGGMKTMEVSDFNSVAGCP